MEDISQLLSSLSSDDINMLKGMADSILGGGSADNSQQQATTQPAMPQPVTPANQSPLAGLNLGGNELAMIMKVKSAYDKMSQNSTSNDKVQLIQALKPHLSDKRQRRADEALQLMRMMDMLPLLKELF